MCMQVFVCLRIFRDWVPLSLLCHFLVVLHKEKSIKDLASTSNFVWRRQWQPTPVLLPGKSHGQRSLVGCSPWDHEESDMTEWLHFHFSFSCIREGNGNPLQCSCLENPRDSETWWAAVYGVAQSRTWLTLLKGKSQISPNGRLEL